MVLIKTKQIYHRELNEMIEAPITPVVTNLYSWHHVCVFSPYDDHFQSHTCCIYHWSVRHLNFQLD